MGERNQGIENSRRPKWPEWKVYLCIGGGVGRRVGYGGPRQGEEVGGGVMGRKGGNMKSHGSKPYCVYSPAPQSGWDAQISLGLIDS